MFIHNGIEFDYCFVEALQSLLDVCDEVSVVDAGSTDATRECLNGMAYFNGKLTITSAPWEPAPGNGFEWLIKLANLAREQLTTDYHFSLQADEVLHVEDYEKIRAFVDRGGLGFIRRLNFWRDAQHWCHVGGRDLFRLAPIQVGNVQGDGHLDSSAPGEVIHTGIHVYHYGALRRFEPLRKKTIEQELNVWGFDTIDMFGSGKKLLSKSRKEWDDFYEADLLPFEGTHPPIMRNWLTERGYVFETPQRIPLPR